MPEPTTVIQGIKIGYQIFNAFYSRRKRDQALRRRVREQTDSVVLSESPIYIVYGTYWAGVRPSFFALNPSPAYEGKVSTGVYPICVGSRNGTGVEGIEQISFGDRTAVNPVTQDPSLLRTASGIVADADDKKGFRKEGATRLDEDDLAFRYSVWYGNHRQEADSTLVRDFPKWTTAHRMNGIAYLAIDWRISPERLGNFPSNIRVRVKGQKLWNPETTLWEFSNNPALCILDYLLSDGYGLGVAESDIDLQSFIEGMRLCDQIVEPEVAGVRFTRKLYTCDGALSTGDSLQQNMGRLLASCNGTLIWQDGKIRLHIPHAVAESDIAELVLNADVVEPPIEYSRAGTDQVSNRISAQFLPEGSNTQSPDSVDWPAVGSDNPFLDEDGGIERVMEVDFQFTNDYYRAQMLAALLLREARADVSLRLIALEAALVLEVGQVVRVDLPESGFTMKPFWIIAMQLRDDDRVQLELREYDAEAYDYPDLIPEPDKPASDLPDPYEIAAPTNLRLLADDSVAIQVDTTTRVPAILVRWDASTSAYIAGYEIQWRRDGETDYVSGPTTAADAVRSLLSPAQGGQEYDVRVRAVNDIGIASDWVSGSVEVVTTQITAVGTFTLDRDGLVLNLRPFLGAARSFKWAIATTNDGSEPADPNAAAVRRGACNVGVGEIPVHTFTDGVAQRVKVSALFYSDTNCSQDEGPLITSAFTYDPSAPDVPLLTWSPAVPQGADPGSKEAVRLVATYGREDPTGGEVAIYHRNYVRGTTPPAYTRNPAAGYSEDPLQQRVEVVRPAEGATPILIEAYAESFNRTQSAPVVIVVDGDAIPSISASLIITQTDGKAYLTVNTNDSDTGSYRARVAVGAAGSDAYESVAFESHSREVSGSHTVGGDSGGGRIGVPFLLPVTVGLGQAVFVSIYGLRTTSTSASAQRTSKRSPEKRLFAARAAAALGFFELDQDNLAVKLVPQLNAGQSLRYAVQSGTPDSRPRQPRQSEIEAGPVITAETTIHTLTDGSPAILRVGVIFYTDTGGTTGAGPAQHRVFEYDPSAAQIPQLTWYQALPAGAAQTNKEAVRLVATHATSDPDDATSVVAIFARNYLRGSSPPGYSRLPSSGFADDPLERTIEVARPVEGGTPRLIEAYAEAWDGSVSTPIVIVVDGDTVPSLSADLIVDPSTQQPRITVRTNDPDTGSYRGRWWIGDANQDLSGGSAFLSPSFSDSDVNQFSGNMGAGGTGGGARFGREFNIGSTLQRGQKITVVLYALRTTSTAANSQGSSKRSEPQEYSSVQGVPDLAPGAVEIIADGNLRVSFVPDPVDARVVRYKFAGIRVRWGRGVRSIRIRPFSAIGISASTSRDLDNLSGPGERTITGLDFLGGSAFRSGDNIFPLGLQATPFPRTNFLGGSGEAARWQVTMEEAEGLRGIVVETENAASAAVRVRGEMPSSGQTSPVGMTEVKLVGGKMVIDGVRVYRGSRAPSGMRDGDIFIETD